MGDKMTWTGSQKKAKRLKAHAVTSGTIAKAKVFEAAKPVKPQLTDTSRDFAKINKLDVRKLGLHEPTPIKKVSQTEINDGIRKMTDNPYKMITQRNYTQWDQSKPWGMDIRTATRTYKMTGPQRYGSLGLGSISTLHYDLANPWTNY